MASIAAERAAIGQVNTLLQDAAAASARALADRRGTPSEPVLERQLEHTLDRRALLYGRGTYENLTTEDILRSAVGNELRLAAELGEPESAAAAARARSLVDAARRGVRLHLRAPAPAVRLYRGVYVEPLRPEVAAALHQSHEPFLSWRDGAVLIAPEEQADSLRAAGDQVDVLFLDADELLDLDGRDDRPALEAELGRRLRTARADPGHLGDSPDRHVRRLLLGQSVVLRNLRDRLDGDHPSAHRALLPVLSGHTALLAGRLAAAPLPGESLPGEPLATAIGHERNLHALATRWAAEPGDAAGLRGRFQAVAEAGTHLADLERLSR
jgi:hypothetical protein